MYKHPRWPSWNMTVVRAHNPPWLPTQASHTLQKTSVIVKVAQYYYHWWVPIWQWVGPCGRLWGNNDDGVRLFGRGMTLFRFLCDVSNFPSCWTFHGANLECWGQWRWHVKGSPVSKIFDGVGPAHLPSKNSQFFGVKSHFFGMGWCGLHTVA
jgi:hypothetical protein